MQKKLTHIFILSLLVALASCTGDDQPSSPQPSLRFAVEETPWQEHSILLTRSDDSMLADLKSSSAGFGFYCPALFAKNLQVTWNSASSKWNYGKAIIWDKNITDAAFSAYAYAPYNGSVSITDGTLHFTSATNNTTDLLWAKGDRTDDVIAFTFKHALTNISFGTLTNNYGHSVTLTSITFDGFHTEGDLSLTTGEWSNRAGSQTISRSPALTVSAGSTGNIAVDDILQIPVETVKATLSFTSEFGEETATFTLSFNEPAINHIINLTITNNFEVIIQP